MRPAGTRRANGSIQVRSVGTVRLCSMRFVRSIISLAALLLAVTVFSTASAPAAAAPSATSEARLEAATKRLESARARSAKVDAQVSETSRRLDDLIAEQDGVRSRLRARSTSMYRSGDTSFLSVLLGASTFEEFTTRWDLLKRMNRQDAQDLALLEAARRDAERSARELMVLQADAARAVAAVDKEVAQTRKQLAADAAAREAYEARVGAAARSESSSKPSNKQAASKQPRGSGAWKTAVASHYSRNFNGRGASGEEIGPYSMIVAHKTLPFGTLIEFEYKGKRAVAHVADRGPYTPGRTFDLGPGVVRTLDFSGVDEVRYRIIK